MTKKIQNEITRSFKINIKFIQIFFSLRVSDLITKEKKTINSFVIFVSFMFSTSKYLQFENENAPSIFEIVVFDAGNSTRIKQKKHLNVCIQNKHQ